MPHDNQDNLNVHVWLNPDSEKQDYVELCINASYKRSEITDRYDFEYCIERQLNSMMFSHQPSALGVGKIQVPKGEVIPNDFIWHDKFSRYLISAHLVSLGGSLIFAVFFQTSMEKLVFTSSIYQFSLIVCLLSYASVFFSKTYNPMAHYGFKFLNPFIVFCLRHSFALLFSSFILLIIASHLRFL